MRTLKQLANLIVNSESKLGNAQKNNFNVWVTVYQQFNENFEAKISELKAAIIEAKIPTKTVENRLGMFNTASKNGLNLSNFDSFNDLATANKNVKNEVAKVVNGKIVNDDKKTAEKQIEAEVIKAQNENDLVQLLALESFRKFKADFKNQGFSTSVLLQALKTV